MAVEVDDVTTLQAYLQGVVGRADHHGENVREVVLPLVGAVVLFKNPDQSIKVMPTEGGTGNVLWFYIGDSRYVLSYSHPTKSIVLKDRSIQGEQLATFTNATSTAEILRVFKSLAQ